MWLGSRNLTLCQDLGRLLLPYFLSSAFWTVSTSILCTKMSYRPNQAANRIFK